MKQLSIICSKYIHLECVLNYIAHGSLKDVIFSAQTQNSICHSEVHTRLTDFMTHASLTFY